MDRSGGPNHGTLYAAWVRIRTTASRQRNRIAVSRSSDGGHSFSAPELISSARRFALGPQLAVQPDGTLQVVWASFRRSEGERRGTVLRAASRDGGGSFSAPRRIERFANGPAAYNLVALAASAAGRLLACWSQAGALGRATPSAPAPGRERAGGGPFQSRRMSAEPRAWSRSPSRRVGASGSRSTRARGVERRSACIALTGPGGGSGSSGAWRAGTWAATSSGSSATTPVSRPRAGACSPPTSSRGAAEALRTPST